jgi:hypothetical protein
MMHRLDTDVAPQRMWLMIALWAAVVPAGAMGVAAERETLELTIEAGNHSRTNTPVRTVVEVPQTWLERRTVHFTDGSGGSVVGQLTAPGLSAEGNERSSASARELHLVLPRLEAGKKIVLSAAGSGAPVAGGSAPAAAATSGFAWSEVQDKETVLERDGRPVLRYMHEPIDTSSPERREATYKVFHHVYDPAGEALLTKGPGGRYTHHRGLFFGFNRVSYGDKQADVWHCRDDAYQSHDAALPTEAGPVLGRHRVTVGWHGAGGEVFATEEREMGVYAAPDGHLIEFASRVVPTLGPVRLDGDPQHAGFHFRAAQEVAAETAKETYYLRPDGKGAAGETRNWPDDQRQVNLPWNAMSFVIGGQRYTAAYLDHPKNPKPARYSERDYGRFGCYFEYELTAESPLAVNYRVWIQRGEMSGAQVAGLAADFSEPPTVAVAWK